MFGTALNRSRHPLALAALCCATSCVVPARVPGTATAQSLVPAATPPHEQAIARAEPLLQGLDLTVAPANDPNVAAALPAAAPEMVRAVAAPPFAAAARSLDDAARATDCLTAAVYYEARSEPVDGQRAVAQVVLNRVRDRAFPASVCGVVYQGSTRRTGCQFSFTCDGSMLAPRDWPAWDRAGLVARAALSGLVYAPVGSATYYHANYVNPWWAPSLSRVAVVGQHIFYRWKGALENALAFRQAYSGVEPLPAAPAPLPLPEIADAGAGAVDTVTTDDGTVRIHRGTLSASTPALGANAPVDVVAGVRIHRVRVHVGNGGSETQASPPAAPTEK